MESSNHVVRLLGNRTYPTYQFSGSMDNTKTLPQDGLRLGALTVLSWLCQRLGDPLPKQLQNLPDPSLYLSLSDDVLCSFHVDNGYSLDVTSLSQEGVWSLRITEPDRGSDPGNAEQERAAVPGRIIITDVGFRISSKRLLVGVQIQISEPEETPEKAEVYRPSFIKTLSRNPAFGLQHIQTLQENPVALNKSDYTTNLFRIWNEKDNYLPLVVFTTAVVEAPKVFSLSEYSSIAIRMSPNQPDFLPQENSSVPVVNYLMDDLEQFSRSCFTFCRTYILDDGQWNAFTKKLEKPDLKKGSIVVLYPKCFGKDCKIFDYKASEQRLGENLQKLKAEMKLYPRGKTIDFGEVSFYVKSQQTFAESVQTAYEEVENAKAWSQQIVDQAEKTHSDRIQEHQETIAELNDRIARQKKYIASLEAEKAQIAVDYESRLAEKDAFISDLQEEITFYQRKLDRPRDYTGIASWVETHFSDRIIIHDKARKLLAENEVRTVDIDLIYDALDFLATDYWEQRYKQLPQWEVNNRCSRKYNRPFDIKPTGNVTIEYTPSQYKIKYFIGKLGKPVESPLDYHLVVGRDAEFLLRIYFLHDDKKQKIVIGSLPGHLRAVSIS